MECPYCNAELINTDWYGRKINGEHYWIPSHWEKEGDIFRCPNSEGFEEKEEAREYDPNFEGEDWEEISCESFCHNGSFYTDSSGDLSEGHPC